MFRSGALLALCLSTASAQPPAIPSTPAGRTFKAWLKAFNSGDRELVAAYVKRYEAGRTVGEILELRATTGGFDLTQVVRSERFHLDVALQDRNRSKHTYASLDVTDADPAVVTHFNLYDVPPWDFAATIDPPGRGPSAYNPRDGQRRSAQIVSRAGSTLTLRGNPRAGDRRAVDSCGGMR